MHKKKLMTLAGLLGGAAAVGFGLSRQRGGEAGGTKGRWTTADMPHLGGQTAVVTGANSGIGYEAALALAEKGAHVVLACRSLAKGEMAMARILASVPWASVALRELDLASLTSINHFAQQTLADQPKLDLLINNAGVMAIPYRETAEGFEMQFGTNHLGHFALTGLLLPAILAAENGRIVTVSSNLHRVGRIAFDDLHGRNYYSRRAAYSQSKLANLLFANELQRRLAAAGARAISVACHPGWAATNLQFVGPRMEGSALSAGVMTLANALLSQDAAMGALPTLYAAVAAGVEGCDYIGPDGFMRAWGYPIKERATDDAYDEAAAARLWAISAELTGVTYEALAAATAPSRQPQL